MRILYITTIGSTMGFFNSFIKLLLDEGHIVEIAANENGGKVPEYYREWGCKVHQIDTYRSPLRKENLIAIRQIRVLVERSKYDIVHCHTPVAAMCTRIACRRIRKSGTKVFYTAHGFHFYKGAPLKNWLLYYPIEKICSYWTDVIITINQEDYERAKANFKSSKVFFVPGVGIDIEKYSMDKKSVLTRMEIGIPEDAFFVVSAGELNKNKNHSTVIRAIGELNDPNIHYAIAGEGVYRDRLNSLIQSLKLEKQIHLLGYRDDIPSLYACADLCAFPSIREGQGLAAIEAMAAGLPLVVSDNRGLRGILSRENAIICKYNDIQAFVGAIKTLKENPDLREKMGQNNKIKSKNFSTEIINSQMKKIYSGVKQ